MTAPPASNTVSPLNKANINSSEGEESGTSGDTINQAESDSHKNENGDVS